MTNRKHDPVHTWPTKVLVYFVHFWIKGCDTMHKKPCGCSVTHSFKRGGASPAISPTPIWMVLLFWPLKSAFARLLLILWLATRDIFHILKLLYKMFCVALADQTNRRDVPHASRRFITLLNAFNKVVSRLCSDGSTPPRCLCVCTTLITSVVFVCSPLCVPFWQRCCVIAFCFMRGSWFNMMRKKNPKKHRPNSQISCSWVRGKCSSREQTPVPVPRAPPGPRTCRWHLAPRFHLR